MADAPLMAGKSVLVTGGTGGIGRQIALSLAEEGAQIAIVGRRYDRAAVEEIGARGVRVVGIEADVSREAEVVRMVEQTLRELGRIDLYVNNAATAEHQPFTKISAEAWQRVLNTNLAACLWGCREVSRHMIARRQGSILIVGSTSIYTPGPGEPSTPLLQGLGLPTDVLVQVYAGNARRILGGNAS